MYSGNSNSVEVEDVDIESLASSELSCIVVHIYIYSKSLANT